MAKTDQKKGRDGRPPGHRPSFNPLGSLLKWTVTLAVWGVIAGVLLVAWYAADLPDVDEALAAPRRPGITILAGDGTQIATYGDLYRKPVSLAEVPRALKAAVLATEDRRFYDHIGIDFIGLARAMVANLRAGHIVQGGSTITQQAAKNLFLTPERSLKRKAQEVMLALWLEHRFTKDQILTIYLNRVYLGAGTYGVEAAAWRYFDKPAKDLSAYECALLAGLLKAPSRYSPASNPDRANDRAAVVIDNMVDVGFLSEAQGEAAKRQRTKATRGVRPLQFAKHFADWVMERLPGYVTVGNQDLVVVTTLDPRLQRIAEDQVDAVLDASGKVAGAGEAAVLTLSPEGAVKVMVGGRDYGQSQFNRATQALRQPGSAFKPFVYLAALEAGLTPQSRVLDAPVTVDGWNPGNFDGRYRGDVSLIEAFAQSLNTAAVRVAQRAGPQRIIDVARRFGMTTEMTPQLSLALGTSEVSLLELTAAYGVFANGGVGVWPYAIQEIRDTHGVVLYRRSGSGPGPVVSSGLVLQMADMMTEVMEHGTGRTARLDRPAAGKTGTSQNFRDAWFVGYTADYVTGVWMGNDDGGPMHRVAGGGLPASLWKRVMTAAEQGLPIRPLPRPMVEVAAEERAKDKDGGFWARLLAPILTGTKPLAPPVRDDTR